MEQCTECAATIEIANTCWGMATPYCIECWERQQHNATERGN